MDKASVIIFNNTAEFENFVKVNKWWGYKKDPSVITPYSYKKFRETHEIKKRGRIDIFVKSFDDECEPPEQNKCFKYKNAGATCYGRWVGKDTNYPLQRTLHPFGQVIIVKKY